MVSRPTAKSREEIKYLETIYCVWPTRDAQNTAVHSSVKTTRYNNETVKNNSQLIMLRILKVHIYVHGHTFF